MFAESTHTGWMRLERQGPCFTYWHFLSAQDAAWWLVDSEDFD